MDTKTQAKELVCAEVPAEQVHAFLRSKSGPREKVDPFLFYSIDENRENMMKLKPAGYTSYYSSRMLSKADRKTRLATETDLLNVLLG